MQALAGILFVAALALAVLFGGQTVDYSWGPALVVLAPAVLLSLAGFRQLRERGWGAWLCSLLLASAWGWTLYACAHSPVKQFARSDALLVGGMILCFVYGLLLQPAGKTGRLLMGGLALLGIANGVAVLLQVSDPDFSWPFASRPSLFPSGFFGHYNHLADFAAVGAALLTARLLFAKDRLAERILQALGIVFFGLCIAFAKSRGGLVGCAAAAEVIAVGAFLVALRERSKWLRLLALLPLLFLVLGGLAGSWMLKSFESARGVENASAQGFADNRSRLVLYGIALRVSADHPLTGGGSRSFGWRKYSSWNSDPSAQDGKMPTNDDFAHNEVLQTAVDYGWLGAGLVVLAIMTTGLTGVAGLMMKDEHARSPRFAADATVIGGLAGMTATLVNSNFSFVTHTFPGAMYLGLTLAMVLPRRTPAPVAYTRRLLAGIPVTIGALATAIPVFLVGITACRVFLTTWPVANSNLAIVEPNVAADRLKDAAALWPDSSLSNAAGQLCQAAAARPMIDPAEIIPLLHRADGFYQDAAKAYPYSPHWLLNRANVLVSLSKDDPSGPVADEAERTFKNALYLQGGMEGLLRVRYFYAQFLIYRWDVLWRKERRADEALAKFLYARRLLTEAKDMTEPYIQLDQITSLLTQVEEKIVFLQGAGIEPADTGEQ